MHVCMHDVCVRERDRTFSVFMHTQDVCTVMIIIGLAQQAVGGRDAREKVAKEVVFAQWHRCKLQVCGGLLLWVHMHHGIREVGLQGFGCLDQNEILHNHAQATRCDKQPDSKFSPAVACTVSLYSCTQ